MLAIVEYFISNQWNEGDALEKAFSYSNPVSEAADDAAP